MTRKRALIIVNASSGFDSKQDAPRRLSEWFRDTGIEPHIEMVQHGMNLADRAREAVHEGYEIVIAAGGDGTLSAVASGLIGTDVTFGVLPVGTLNHFARDLHLPLDMEQAARIICTGETAIVDTAEVNGKTFLNNSIIGLYPVFRFLRAQQERNGMPRKLALLWGTFAALRRYPFFTIRMWIQGREVVRRTPYLMIANNRHGMDGWQLGLRDSLNEGKLWIYVMRPQSRLSLLWMVAKLITGAFHGHQHFEIMTAEELYVETRSKRLGVALDGEIHVMQTPLRYRALPGSLQVFAPARES